MLSKPFSLSKHERLKSKKQIDALFLKGEAFFVFPFKVKYIFFSESNLPSLKFGISVPKRNFKKAVDRNRLKRLSREAYRLNKIPLKEISSSKKCDLQMMFIYTHQALLTYGEVEMAMNICLKKLIKMATNSNP